VKQFVQDTVAAAMMGFLVAVYISVAAWLIWLCFVHHCYALLAAAAMWVMLLICFVIKAVGKKKG
jgi:cation transporter-like permease